MRIAIRADASLAIGSGHIMRCAALAQALHARAAEVLFLCRTEPGHMADWLAASGYAVRRLAPAHDAIDWRDDAAATLAALDGAQADWIIVDHYQLDARWERTLRAGAARVMAIDDLADRAHDCEVLLDQNYYPDSASRYDPHLAPGCLRLLGPSYALLRPQFRQARQQRRTRDGSVARLLCFFGGSDAGNETGKALAALALLARPGLAVDVVVGAANPHRARIAQQCAALPGATFHCQVENMAQLMLDADLCLGAAGSTTWERCCLGLPSLLVALADNQVALARALADQGCLRFLGAAADLTPHALAQALAELIAAPGVLRQMAERSEGLVDTLGAERVARQLCGPETVAPINLRCASIDDEAKLFEWRNAPEVRAASFDPQPIPLDQHISWLRAVLADPARHLLVAECAGQPVAVLRYDTPGPEAQVSVYLLPGLSGAGLGTRVLQAGNTWLRAHLPQLTQVRARILPANLASRGAFLKAGYVPCGRDYIVTLVSAGKSTEGT